MNSEKRWERARYMFELMEEERREGVNVFRGFSMGTEVKLTLANVLKRVKDKLEASGNYQAKLAIDTCMEQIEKEDKERKAKELEETEKAKGKKS